MITHEEVSLVFLPFQQHISAWYRFNGTRLLSFIKTFPFVLCCLCVANGISRRYSNECKILVMNLLHSLSAMISLSPRVICCVWLCFLAVHSPEICGYETVMNGNRVARLPIKLQKVRHEHQCQARCYLKTPNECQQNQNLFSFRLTDARIKPCCCFGDRFN